MTGGPVRVRASSRLIVAWGVLRWFLEATGGLLRFVLFLFTRGRIRADIRRRIEAGGADAENDSGAHAENHTGSTGTLSAGGRTSPEGER